NIIFIAPPAAGKVTQAEMLSSKYSIPHISTGDILRNASLEDTERGRMIANEMSLGNFISDDIIIELLKERLTKSDCNNGYILDGFPRNIEQAKQYEIILKEMNKKIDYVIYLDIDEETASNRILGRISCNNCGSVYNELIESAKPKVNGICDKCNSKLIKRLDDNAETFKNRFDAYVNKTKPLIDYYKEKGILYCVDSNLEKENTFKQIEDLIRGNI
ncbi:MAG TPA: adenylate kinase, partial [Bacilli bacterium]|nr:adenylate kinase [Bacilli bacterium]